jgi:hypothetical protein
MSLHEEGPGRPSVERFVHQLIEFVRDKSIHGLDLLASGTMRGPSGQYWNQFISNEQVREAVLALIPDMVDEALFNLIDAVEKELLDIAIRDDDGEYRSLCDLGKSEMAGNYAFARIWIEKYSQQRYVDYNADIPLE